MDHHLSQEEQAKVALVSQNIHQALYPALVRFKLFFFPLSRARGLIAAPTLSHHLSQMGALWAHKDNFNRVTRTAVSRNLPLPDVFFRFEHAFL